MSQDNGPHQATIDELKQAVQLGGSSDLFLTAYINTSREEVMNGGLRAHVHNLLEEIAEEVEATPLRDIFRTARERVAAFAETIRPGVEALAILSNAREDSEPKALWLPGTVSDEVRFGPGTYVLPLVNVLDEWEPIVLAFVQKDQAQLILAGAGIIEEVRESAANVPGRHKQGGEAERRYERHTVVHMERHLDEVAKELEQLVVDNQVKRVFLSGPVEAASRFKDDLPQRIRNLVAAEVPLDAHASPHEALERLWPIARDVERREEGALVEELITRAEKDALGITDANETLAAINRHEARQVVISADAHIDGRYCIGSGMLFGPMGAAEEQCQGPVRTVWLRQDLPCYALQRGIEFEVVHGDAARRLNQYGGIGAFLHSPRR